MFHALKREALVTTLHVVVRLSGDKSGSSDRSVMESGRDALWLPKELWNLVLLSLHSEKTNLAARYEPTFLRKSDDFLYEMVDRLSPRDITDASTVKPCGVPAHIRYHWTHRWKYPSARMVSSEDGDDVRCRRGIALLSKVVFWRMTDDQHHRRHADDILGTWPEILPGHPVSTDAFEDLVMDKRAIGLIAEDLRCADLAVRGLGSPWETPARTAQMISAMGASRGGVHCAALAHAAGHERFVVALERCYRAKSHSDDGGRITVGLLTRLRLLPWLAGKGLIVVCVRSPCDL